MKATSIAILLGFVLIVRVLFGGQTPYEGARLVQVFTIEQMDEAVARESEIRMSAAAVAGARENEGRSIPEYTHFRQFPLPEEWRAIRGSSESGDVVARFDGEKRSIDGSQYVVTFCLMRADKIVATVEVPLDPYRLKKEA